MSDQLKKLREGEIIKISAFPSNWERNNPEKLIHVTVRPVQESDLDFLYGPVLAIRNRRLTVMNASDANSGAVKLNGIYRQIKEVLGIVIDGVE